MVSHNKRIVAALAAVAAMGIGLAGCGGSDTAGDTKSGSDGGVVNITYMHRLPDSEGMTLVRGRKQRSRTDQARPEARLHG